MINRYCVGPTGYMAARRGDDEPVFTPNIDAVAKFSRTVRHKPAGVPEDVMLAATSGQELPRLG
jgi:hypothetical protein